MSFVSHMFYVPQICTDTCGHLVLENLKLRDIAEIRRPDTLSNTTNAMCYQNMQCIVCCAHPKVSSNPFTVGPGRPWNFCLLNTNACILWK